MLGCWLINSWGRGGGSGGGGLGGRGGLQGAEGLFCVNVSNANTARRLLEAVRTAICHHNPS